MALPAVSVDEDQIDVVEVPAFWPKRTAEPLFRWKLWIGQDF